MFSLVDVYANNDFEIRKKTINKIYERIGAFKQKI